ncbi:shikimate kinase [Helicobacter macacae]|uniref:shikimate kinase n=1 Tax=Helicobacter macacae TaxID=398626 RepID=UPI0011DCB4CA|nr:shikimate kinase [Helicobacter macacae]
MLDSANIVLIGFMGSGKSSVAKNLGKRYSQSQNPPQKLSQKTLRKDTTQRFTRFVLDSDEMISKNLGMSISQYFKRRGEEAFRLREAEFIAWVCSSVKNAIISTGGGMPIFNDVKQMGFVVYLEIGFDEILSRLDSIQRTKRPLFRDLKKAKEIFLYRKDIYKNTADLVIDASKPLESITQEILNHHLIKA